MIRYLLDTNHLSAYLDGHARLVAKVEAALRIGDRFGICLPILCEYRAGILVSRRFRQNLARLQAALSVFRVWPTDDATSDVFAEIYQELRAKGAMLSQFDLLIAAVSRQRRLTLLTADSDFQPLNALNIENWIA